MRQGGRKYGIKLLESGSGAAVWLPYDNRMGRILYHSSSAATNLAPVFFLRDQGDSRYSQNFYDLLCKRRLHGLLQLGFKQFQGTRTPKVPVEVKVMTKS